MPLQTMTRIKCRIVGISPLLMHAIPDELLFPESKPVHTGEKLTPKEQAEKAVYTNGNDEPVIPLENLFKCIIEGGKFHKMGRSKVTTRDSSLVPAGITIEGTSFPISPPEWEVDSRMVTNQNTKGKVPSHRPRFDQWSIEFELIVDTSMFSLDLVRKIVDDAGQKIGLCSRRPETKGPFGKFRVECWKVQTDHG